MNMETKQRQRKPWRHLLLKRPSEVCTGPEGEMAQSEELSVAILEKAEGGINSEATFFTRQ